MQYFAQIDECCALLNSGAIDRVEFIQQCLCVTSEKIGSARTGLWLFLDKPDGRRMTCLGVYERKTGQVRLASDRMELDAGDYFDELDRIGYVVANDVNLHPATSRFFGRRQEDMGIVAVMAAAISLNGRLFGAFTCTEDTVRQWSGREVAALNKIASRITLALASASTSQLDSLLGSL